MNIIQFRRSNDEPVSKAIDTKSKYEINTQGLWLPTSIIGLGINSEDFHESLEGYEHYRPFAFYRAIDHAIDQNLNAMTGKRGLDSYGHPTHAVFSVTESYGYPSYMDSKIARLRDTSLEQVMTFQDASKTIMQIVNRQRSEAVQFIAKTKAAYESITDEWLDEMGITRLDLYQGKYYGMVPKEILAALGLIKQPEEPVLPTGVIIFTSGNALDNIVSGFQSRGIVPDVGKSPFSPNDAIEKIIKDFEHMLKERHAAK